MSFLVLGATGKTGRVVVQKLLERGKSVRVIVRSEQNLPAEAIGNPNVKIHVAPVLDVPDETFVKLVGGCSGVLQCLGHRGPFGPPKSLVRDTLHKIYDALEQTQPKSACRVVLLSSCLVDNPDGSDKKIRSIAQNILLGLLERFIPPHKDNVKAAEYLYKDVGSRNELMEWAVVRPDALDNAEECEYEVHRDLLRSLFSPARTTRANIADFMVDLVLNDKTWEDWKCSFPYIKNKGT